MLHAASTAFRYAMPIDAAAADASCRHVSLLSRAAAIRRYADYTPPCRLRRRRFRCCCHARFRHYAAMLDVTPELAASMLLMPPA